MVFSTTSCISLTYGFRPAPSGCFAARGALAAELVDYFLSIRPPNACGPIQLNPSTGMPYVDIRKQWNRLIEIASRMLGYELTEKKADFFNVPTPAHRTSRSVAAIRSTSSSS
jgi:hypothetical protein